MDVNFVFDLFRCSESLWSIFDNAAAPENRKLAIYDLIYPARNERSCVDVLRELVGENNATAHNLCRIRSTLLMRRLVIDGASGRFSLWKDVDSLAAADVFMLDRMRRKLEL